MCTFCHMDEIPKRFRVVFKIGRRKIREQDTCF